MELTTDHIKELRDRTGVSISECRKALEEAEGDIDAAIALLRGRAVTSAQMKEGRELGAGVVGSYTHDGVMGAMVILSCETDFVAKNPDFGVLARDLAMQVAAMNPESASALSAEPFIKDGGRTIQDLLNEAAQKFGERVEIGSYARLAVH